MATTSCNPPAGTAIVGQGGNGKGHKGRVAGLVVTAALGLGLLAGVVLGHGRQATAPSAALPGATAPHVYVALGDRDDPRFAGAATAPHVYVALGDRDDARFAGAATAIPDQPIHRPAIYDGSQPGFLEPLPGERPGSAPGLPSYRESHGLD